ncbi:hypothetical protein D3C81_1280260 [compost metagenome]
MVEVGLLEGRVEGLLFQGFDLNVRSSGQLCAVFHEGFRVGLRQVELISKARTLKAFCIARDVLHQLIRDALAADPDAEDFLGQWGYFRAVDHRHAERQLQVDVHVT